MESDVTQSDWGLLTPEEVSEFINFSGAESWQYDANNRVSMASKQTEGVAYLWNQLGSKGSALLADEVGMGKTFQALGVAALLWKMKPSARVLVMTPNRDICRHWKKECETFFNSHYRLEDENSGPIVKLCFKLDQLAKAVEEEPGHLFLTTISTLSNLVPNDEECDNRAATAANVAEGFHRRLKKALDGDDGFDLIIVDEAHYLRNVGGGSQRVAAAKALFGNELSRLSQHNLLLTATPSHTRLSNVASILSYFIDDIIPENENEAAKLLLDKYALRRLRLMEGEKGFYAKQHYRNEQPAPSTFDGLPNAELFFALYQKRLVYDLKKKNDNRSLMYVYLEGFESMGANTDQVGLSKSEPNGQEGESSSEDFHASITDTLLLAELTRDYHTIFNEYPDHPKYGKIVEQCLPKTLITPAINLIDHKHLIFVRRVPSVRELTKRMNFGYDKLLASMIIEAWGLLLNDPLVVKWKKSSWSREEFKRLIQTELDREDSPDTLSEQNESSDNDEEFQNDGGDDSTEYLASRIAQLFVFKKQNNTNDEYTKGQTDCTNVRRKFINPDGLFSLFLEPASDYIKGGYDIYYYDEESKRSDYRSAAKDKRLKVQAAPHNKYDTKVMTEVMTVWSLVVPLLSESLQKKLKEMSEVNKTKVESFANYLKAGFLYASPVMVELYCWFVKFRRENKNHRDILKYYNDFMFFVEDKILNSMLFNYFIAALETFDDLCNKISNPNPENWKSLQNLTSPAWFACGDNKEARQRLILGFNSPFYPNVLVSTSVLQEGVNLHLQCYQVHHYGLAGSPGSNEQRVGRIDRLFGCVNQRLKSGTKKDLNIFYPYLQGSVDEEQVASFIERKHGVEAQMDACLQSNFDKTVHLSSAHDWQLFLKKPIVIDNQSIDDPYPAKFDKPENIKDYEPKTID